MKIGIIVPGGVDRSGRERVIPAFLWLFERLTRDHEVHVYALYQESTRHTYQLRGAHVVTLGRRFRRIALLREVLRENRRGRFDVLHGFWIYPAGLAAAVVATLLRCRSAVYVLGGELASLPDIGYGGSRYWTRRTLMRVALTLADQRVTLSPFIGDIVRSMGFESHDLMLGVALDEWPVSEPSPSRGEPRFVMIGSLNPVKDHFTALQAFHAVVDAVPEARMEIVGEDTMHGLLARSARDLGIDHAVHFRGFVPQSELAQLLKGATAFVSSSLFEAGPVAALEAAACGVPVVATNVGILAGLGRRFAFLVEPGDAQALGRAMLQVLNDPADACRRTECLQRWLVDHDADFTARRLVEVYRS